MISTQELNNLAVQAFQEKRWEDAEKLFQQLREKEPDCGKIYAFLGEIRCCLNDLEGGISLFQRAVELLQDAGDQNADDREYLGKVHFLLALACQTIGNRDEAQSSFLLATEYCTKWKEPWIKFGQFHFDNGNHDQAVQCFRKAVAVDPSDVSLWLTIGYLEHRRRNHESAIIAMKRARQFEPESEIANFYLAESLRKTGKDEEAISYYELLIGHNPSHVPGLYGYGLSLLATGDLERGWMGYEARQLCTSGTWERHVLPTWNGEEDLHGTILAFGEEGISAEILFASCLPDLMDKIGYCYIECDRLLHSLFKRSFPGISVVSPAMEEIRPHEFPGIYMDYQIPFGSLPRHFRSHPGDFPIRDAYLVPDFAKLERWRNRFAATAGEKKIGVLWEGTWCAEPEHQRQIPFDQLARIVRAPFAENVHWVSLQHGNHKKEWDHFCSVSPISIEQISEIFTDNLDDMAAMISALDLVIAPSGFQAHLAAALGVPTWVVLPEQCDWRWHLSGSYSPWYPAVKLFRQESGEAYHEMIDRLLELLEDEFMEEPENMILPFPQVARQVSSWYSLKRA